MTKKLLIDHVSEATAFLQDDYPYGRLRCKRRVWLETKKSQGMRAMFQTQNPKNGRWNAPKASTYSSIVVMYLDESNDHVETASINGYTSDEKIEAFETEYGGAFGDYERQAIRLLKAMNRAQKRVVHSVRSDESDSTEPRQTMQQQADMMRRLTIDELKKDKK